eukprot:TRINITY_DN1502_c0_g1_i1.p1 TRINITY_DN1502_c0_g1~~TRINITY_DN1502_c0_g1_i1.p1  ORF type:complete len:117 (+),score=24.13 TRINITY_DN1502_c0_g1_i1:95-445(+)
MKGVVAGLVLIVACLFAFSAAQDPVCETCEIIVVLAEAAIKVGHYNTTQIENILVQGCKELPSELTAICQLVVAQYGDAIIKDLVAGKPSDQICDLYVQLCPSSAEPKTLPLLLKD